jgi:hypothetical protein
MQPTESILFEVLKFSWGLIVPWVLWLHRRVDKMTQESVRRTEFTGMINSLRDEIRASNHQITTRLDSFIALIMEKK